MLEVEVGELAPHELWPAVQMLSRAFRDNPLPVAVFGQNPERRRKALERYFSTWVPTLGWIPLCARRNGWVTGLVGIAPPGRCRLGPWRFTRLALAVARGGGPRSVPRALTIASLWEKWDPAQGHWHLGPVGVEPSLQGMGIGSQMLERFCYYMDSLRALAYLETDKPENVRFYERFGFRVIGEEEALGITHWFMAREPSSR